MLSATIAGVCARDVTGNGMDRCDVPLAGVTVKLFRDVNNNGTLDAADGAAVCTATSKCDGSYAFCGLPAGRYFVREVVPTGVECTNPGSALTYTVLAGNCGTYCGNDFDNYVEQFTRSAVTNISYLINGTTVVKSLPGNVHEGDTVTVRFTLTSAQELSLVSYKAPTLPGTGPLSDQTLYDYDTGLFCAGQHCLTVKVPPCYFQLDFVGGPPIDHFGAPGSNCAYTPQHRLIDSATGGDHACTDDSCGCGCGDEKDKEKQKKDKDSECNQNDDNDQGECGDKTTACSSDDGKDKDSSNCGKGNDKGGGKCG